MGLRALLGVLLIGTCIFAYVNGQANHAAMEAAGQASNSGRVGQPQFSVQGGGSGNNRRNWNAGGNVGVGTKVWESKNGRHSVGAAANFGQSFGRTQGHSWKTKPDRGVGVGYTYRFGGGGRRGR